jgi:hypothetical protein
MSDPVADGHEVLAYGTTSRDVRRFTKALEGRLENVPRR